MDIPHADLPVDKALVERLVAEQFPELVAPVELVAEGWDNAIFRLGALGVRMPRRASAAHLVEHEQRWLPELQRLVTVDLPVPVRLGRPDADYPFSWSITPWFDGYSGAAVPARRRSGYAATLARTFAALHVVATPDAPANPVRGVPLAQRSDAVHTRLNGLRSRPELPAGTIDALLRVWDAAAALPAYAGAPVWLHGDPHPGNVVVREDASARLVELVALIDFGDLTAGDPATDLSAAWLHFDAPGRAEFRQVYDEASGGGDDALWQRARAWAVTIGSAAFAASDGNGLMAQMGLAALSHLLED